MSLTSDLLEGPRGLSIASKYTAFNGLIYIALGAPLIVWPQIVQAIFGDAEFVGNEAALVRVVGMAVTVIGWMYLFGGLSGSKQIVAASVLDRLTLVPIVLIPLAIGGVFPHFLLTVGVLDPILAIGAWIFLGRTGALSKA
jgi:hypothetical protein